MKMKNTDSDTDYNPTMAASEAFDQILEYVKLSNLNFCLQLSPFSANISIKKTLIKDKSGVHLNPRIPIPHPLEKKVKDLEVLVNSLQLRLAESVETISELECSLRIKQENIDSEGNDLKAEIEKKSFEISNLKEEKNRLQNKSETLEAALKEQETEIHDLQRNLKNSRCATNKLNKELLANRMNHEKETKIMIKNSKSEIKTWKKDLGRERSEKLKAERKLENLVKKIESKESVACQTSSSTDVPYLVTDPLPPIFGSALCHRSKPIPYISRSLPNLSTLSWVRVTEDDVMVEAAEQALNELFDHQVNEFYKDAKAKAAAMRQVYEENCIGNLFKSD